MVRIAGDTLPHEIRGRNGILLRNTAAEVDGKWCTVGVGGPDTRRRPGRLIDRLGRTGSWEAEALPDKRR